jgi:hypothetical protein
VPTVLKSGSLTLLEPSGPVKACNGIALPLGATVHDLKQNIANATKMTIILLLQLASTAVGRFQTKNCLMTHKRLYAI